MFLFDFEVMKIFLFSVFVVLVFRVFLCVFGLSVCVLLGCEC